MKIKEGILYHFPNSAMSIEDKIQFLVGEYVAKTKLCPVFIDTNVQDGATLPETLDLIVTGVEGVVTVQVYKSVNRMKDHFWIGVEVDN